MTKKVLAVTIAAMLVLSTFTGVFAAEIPTFSFDKTEYDVTSIGDNGTFEVVVCLDKTPQDCASNLQFDILFDSSKLAIVPNEDEDDVTAYGKNAKPSGAVGEALSWAANLTGGSFATSPVSKRKITAASLADSGNKLVGLTFKRLAGATGTATLAFSGAKIFEYAGGDLTTADILTFAQAKGEVITTTATVKFSDDAPVLDKDVTLQSVTVGSDVKTAAPYTFDVDNTVDMTDIVVVPTSAKAKVTCDKATSTDGKTFPSGKLDVGENKFVFTVTAEDTNFKQNYEVIINKAAAPKSNNADLSALDIAGVTLTPAFAADVTSYTASVENTVDKVTVTATAADSKATVAGAGEKTLAVGNNAITVEVTAENGTTTKTYTIVVNRADAPTPVAGAKIAGSVDKTSLNASEDVVVTVELTDLDTSAAMQYELTYDSNVVDYIGTSLADDAVNATAGMIKVAVAKSAALTPAEARATFTFKAKTLTADAPAGFAIANAKYGSKTADPTSWDAVDPANYTAVPAVTVKGAADPLAVAKAAAISEIEAKYSALTAANEYFSDNNLDPAKAAAIATIEAATDEAGVTSAKTDGLAALDAVKTKAALIAEKKAALTADKTLYFEEQHTDVDNAVAAAAALADAASTKADLDAITVDLSGIKTKAEIVSDAQSEIDTAKAAYNSADYYADEYTAITTIADDAKVAAADAAFTKAAQVQKVVDDAKAAMAAVKTKKVVALEKINDTATAYTEELFSDAGVTGAAAANFAKYKLGITKAKADKGADLDLAEVQAVVTEMNSVTVAKKGDLNGNGEIDAGDASIILKYVAGTLTGMTVDGTFLATADFVEDGAISANDAASILATVLGK